MFYFIYYNSSSIFLDFRSWARRRYILSSGYSIKRVFGRDFTRPNNVIIALQCHAEAGFSKDNCLGSKNTGRSPNMFNIALTSSPIRYALSFMYYIIMTIIVVIFLSMLRWNPKNSFCVCPCHEIMKIIKFWWFFFFNYSNKAYKYPYLKKILYVF